MYTVWVWKIRMFYVPVWKNSFPIDLSISFISSESRRGKEKRKILLPSGQVTWDAVLFIYLFLYMNKDRRGNNIPHFLYLFL